MLFLKRRLGVSAKVDKVINLSRRRRFYTFIVVVVMTYTVRVVFTFSLVEATAPQLFIYSLILLWLIVLIVKNYHALVKILESNWKFRIVARWENKYKKHGKVSANMVRDRIGLNVLKDDLYSHFENVSVRLLITKNDCYVFVRRKNKSLKDTKTPQVKF